MEKPSNEFPLKTNPFYRTVQDVAQLLRVSISQVYALIDAGKLRCYRISTGRQGGIRISDDHLAEFLEDCLDGGEELKHIQ